MLSIKVEKEMEILVGGKTRGDRKLDEKVSTKIIERFRCFILQQIYVKITKRKKIFFESSLLSFYKLYNDSTVNIICKIIHL